MNQTIQTLNKIQSKDQFHETELHKALKQHIIVDPHSKDEDEQLGITITKTIQEAVDIAQEGGIIKISAGLYKENIYINKPGLRLEPKEKNGDIIIFAQKSAAIIIDLQPNDKCFIIGIKLCHSGFNEEEINSKLDEYNRIMARIYQQDLQRQDSINSSAYINKQDSETIPKYNKSNLKYQKTDINETQEKENSKSQDIFPEKSQNDTDQENNGVGGFNGQDSKKKSQFSKNKRNNLNQSFANIDQDQLEQDKTKLEQYFLGNNTENICTHLDPVNTLVHHFQIRKNTNCIILLWTGTLFLEDCTLSMGFILTTFQQIMAGVVVNRNSDIVINRCEIKGNKKQPTIGILVKSSDCLIKDSNIHSHQLGGIHLWGNKNTKIKIQNNKIQNCLPKGNGISCGGSDCQILVEGNDISKNFIGVNVGIANQAQVLKNQIYFNSFGIEVISGDPFIFNNQIEKNLVAGILTRTFGDFRCDGVIKRNEYIRCNKEYGVVCQGEKNFTRIEKNENISYNKKSGVKVEDQAHIYIFRNNIFKNIGQGILVVESASANIESNEIADNLKANIALGGFGSQNSMIVSNKIKGGRCEGIFLIDSSECWILRNKIYENNDGIIMVMSIPWIENNEIYKNKSNGVMAIKDSRPKFKSNLVEQNGFIGLFIRDKSNGDITGNHIWGNKKTNLLVEKKNIKLTYILEDNKVGYQNRYSTLQRLPSLKLSQDFSKQRSNSNQKQQVLQEDGDIRIPQNYRCTLI